MIGLLFFLKTNLSESPLPYHTTCQMRICDNIAESAVRVLFLSVFRVGQVVKMARFVDKTKDLIDCDQVFCRIGITSIRRAY